MQADIEIHSEALQTQLSAIILAASTGLRLSDAAVEDESVVLTVMATQTEAPCPDCGQISTRIHSHYQRTPGDLAIVGQAVRLRLHVRRFFCANKKCVRKTFAERLPEIIKPFARRTNRLTKALCALGQALGGEAGARYAAQLAIPTSPDTLLRLVCNADIRVSTTPTTVLGVDDWAWKKGRTYGTILVDLEQHLVVDLLPERSADSLAAWLEKHPGVKIISRDRAGVYAEGARRGAPDAKQIADRFHLLKNLREALEPLLSREHRHLPMITVTATKSLDAIAVTEPAEVIAGAESCPSLAAQSPDSGQTDGEHYRDLLVAQDGKSPSQTRAERVKHARRERRYARYQQIMELHHQGVSIRGIAQQMGVSRRMARRYIGSAGFPEITQRTTAASVLDRFEPYLRQRWDGGCHNALQLYREIRMQGYAGSRPLVSRWAARLRKTLVKPAKSPTQTAKQPVLHASKRATENRRKLSPTQAAWLLVCRPECLKPEQQAALEQMCQTSTEIAMAYRLAQDFTNMVRHHTAGPLSAWLEHASNSGLRELRSFATGILGDLSAVAAGLTLPWSQGQVEGQVNRLKYLKRAMFGRAGFALLRHRVLSVT